MKKTITIAGFSVTQLNESEYEITNPQEQLDFYFEVGDEEVEILVFDSTIPNKSKDEPFLTIFSCETLEEAVSDAMTFTKADLKRLTTDVEDSE